MSFWGPRSHEASRAQSDTARFAADAARIRIQVGQQNDGAFMEHRRCNRSQPVANLGRMNGSNKP
jgi:hypothetical protein